MDFERLLDKYEHAVSIAVSVASSTHLHVVFYSSFGVMGQETISYEDLVPFVGHFSHARISVEGVALQAPEGQQAFYEALLCASGSTDFIYEGGEVILCGTPIKVPDVLKLFEDLCLLTAERDSLERKIEKIRDQALSLFNTAR